MTPIEDPEEYIWENLYDEDDHSPLYNDIVTNELHGKE